MTYFPPSEQQCPCCRVMKLAPGFLEALDELRHAFGSPMKINSMCRCAARNEAEGGRPGSYHLITKPWGCCAADVSTAGWPGTKKWEFARLAMERGFSVGIAQNFIHIDRRHIHDKDWPKPVLFTY
jgi:hypothetical protein